MRGIPADAEMTSRIQALGYVKGESIANTSFLPPLQCITGHEFHYSRVLRIAMHNLHQIDPGKRY